MTHQTHQITLYGFGYVGQAVFRFLKDHFHISVYDPVSANKHLVEHPHAFPLRSDHITPTKFAVICVPTPMKPDGTCDTSIVEQVIRDSAHQYYLIKSTVIPGTTARLVKETGKQVAFSPEFIGEGKYHIPHWEGYPHPTDMKSHNFHIFGGERVVVGEWVGVWQKVAGWAPTYGQTDSTTAEIVKYAENAYLATQKMFFDQLYEIAKAHGSDYNTVRELLLLDGRVSPAQSIIYPDSRGFAGKCLPKDISGIVKHLESLGHDAHFLKAILTSNEKFRS